MNNMYLFNRYIGKTAVFAVGLLLFSLPSGFADGTKDGVISELYGSTRAIDSGNDVTGDAECSGTAGRGNLMDFFAMSIDGGAGGTNDPWYFSWTVDSSHSLDDTAGSFFGISASNTVNYLIGIEVACDGAPRLEMWENGQPWEREFAWNVDYFIAMFANGPHSMEAQLWRNDGGNSRSMLVGGIAVTSRVVGLRRQVEFVLPAVDPVPEALRNNSTLCLYLMSVQNIDGPGNVLDGVGVLNHNLNCEAAAFDLTSLGSVFINTAANCKESGRPTDAGTNDRQCLSNPNRDTFSAIDGEACAPPFGVSIDGVIDSKYVLLSESSFAAPYSGGASSGSDFVGESSARTYTHVASGTTNTMVLTGGKHADIANVYAYGDTNYLYLIVTGPTSLGWQNEPDLFNMYIAIDMPGETTGNDSGTTTDSAPGAATAPAGRLVNFKGWDPDYAIELVWRGATQGADMPANLFDATGPGTWSLAGSFLYQDIPDTSVVESSLYYSRTFPQYEFAVPWTSLGLSAPPESSDIIRLGVYTTGDENIESASESAWDIADQSPGIGQGCGGEGCHERVGDDALDDDNLSSSGSGDRTPFVGRSYADPTFTPATDNSLNDVDTIEEYFALRIDLPTCAPSVSIEKATNGDDADTPTGPIVSTGSVVIWTYEITNTGQVPLTNVVVHDNQVGFITNFTGGDVNGNALLETNETWTYSATGIAQAGQYANVGTVTGTAVNAAITVSDNDPSHYFGSDPDIDIEKATNGQDADTPTGPSIVVGGAVTWTYAVTNTGNVSLTNVVVTDDQIGVIAGPDSGDVNGNNLLDLGEVWIYSTNGLASAGQYVNTGLVSAVSLIGQSVNDDDPSHYFGGSGGIDIEKATNGDDADTPTGPVVAAGSSVVWTYVLTNTGNEPITNIVVNDSDIGAITNLVSGDANNNSVLETNETWTFTASGLATSGQYSNDSTVAGTTANTGAPVNDNDPSHYFGSTPGVVVEKATNGQDADTPTGPSIVVGGAVTWTYAVTNTGNVSLTNVVVTDDQIGVIAGPDSGDVNGNNLLDLGEVWIYSTNGLASAGQYVNTGLVSAVSLIGQSVNDDDPSHYFGGSGGIDIEKATNGDDADAPTGPVVAAGSNVVWTYVLTNTGNEPITNIVVNDSDIGAITNLVSGDANNNSVLETNETWTFTASGLATSGQYSNDSTVAGTTVNTATPVNDNDPSHYFGSAPGYSLLKEQTVPADSAAFPGDAIAFVITIENTGNVALVTVPVVDTYETNYLAYVDAVPSSDNNDNDGVINWANIGPLASGAVTSITVNFTAVNPTMGERTNSVVTSPTTPVGHPGVPVLTNEAPYEIDAFASLGDFVWRDSNANGIQDPSETGINQIIVSLLNASSNVIGVTTTDLTGAYAFTNLLPGTYSVEFTKPSVLTFTAANQGGSDTNDSDANIVSGISHEVTLVAGEYNDTIDAGLFLPAQLGDFVWNDLDGNGLQDGGETGVVDVVVTLYDAMTNAIGVTTTDVSGAYAFTNLTPGTYSVGFDGPAGTSFSPQDVGVNNFIDSDPDPSTGLTEPVTLVSGENNITVDAGIIFPASIGDFVWADNDNNGIQNGGETGVAEVVVSLLNASSNVIGVTTTDVNGAYAFTNLAPGTYAVQFTQPSGRVFSAANQGGDPALDSDADPVSGITAQVTLISGENNDTIDAGLFAPASVGDFVWRDIFFFTAGVQDPAEGGYDGIVLTLYDTNNVVIGVTTSAPDGSYIFTNLFAGSYYIHAALPLGLDFVDQFVGSDTNKDSNISPFTALTDIFTLQPGEYNPTIDIGIWESVILANTIRAEGMNRQGTAVFSWETDSEYGTVGWFVERLASPDRWERISEILPPSGNISLGGIYEWVDPTAVPGETYTYRLVEKEAHGGSLVSDSFIVTYPEAASAAPAPEIGFALIEKLAPAVSGKRTKKTRALESAPAGATATGVKVAIREDGLYKITDQQIADLLGLNVNDVAASDLRVEHLGLPVKADRESGYVKFYAQGYESRYTDHNIYKIALGAGEAPAEELVTSPGGAPLASYDAAFRIEKQAVFRPDLFTQPDSDPWMWDTIISGIKPTVTTNFDLSNAIAESEGELFMRLKGGSQVTSGDLMHGVRVLLNGTELSADKFPGTSLYDIQVPIPSGVILAAGNVLTIQADPAPGVFFDVYYIDFARITYKKQYVAENNAIVFDSNVDPVHLHGFATNEIDVFDVEDIWNPVKLTGFPIVETAGSWRAEFEAPRAGRYIASASCRTNAELTVWYDSDLKSTEHKVDYLVVHAPELEAGALTLASMRTANGLNTKVVNIESVYNAFNHGIVDGRVLKTFLAYAYYQWAEGPRYFVLVGDGTMDYRNYAGGADCLLPTEPEGSPYGVFSSDHALADVNNDERIEVAVGRIPASTPQHLANYLAKLQTFDTGGAWRQNGFISTDDRDTGGVYINEGDRLEAQLGPLNVTRGDLEVLGKTNTIATIKADMEAGNELMLFVGHGNMYQLAQEPLMSVASSAAITNSDNPCVLGALSCLIGSFTMPNSPSLGKTLMNSEDGVVALFGSASLITLTECRELSKVIMQSVYGDGTDRFGDAWIEAKNAMANASLLRVTRNYQFLGDPATALGAVNAPRGGDALAPVVTPYDIWKTWAFSPAWRDRGIGTGAGDNPDGDELTNEEELQAGTDPMDDDSEIVIVNVKPVGNGDVEVTWPSFAGRTYRVERGLSAVDGYTTLIDDVVATPPLNSHVDSDTVTDSTVYRIYVK